MKTSGSSFTRFGPSYRNAIIASLSIFIIAITYFGFHERGLGLPVHIYSFPNSNGDLVPSGPPTQSHSDTIPNIVHYIWLVKDPEIFHLEFIHFIAVYSAHHYFKPDKIYIHTDASPKLISRLQASTSKHEPSDADEEVDEWTSCILSLPNLHLNHVTAPNQTWTGREIKIPAHRSDFLRPGILIKYGGIYLDMDVVPTRSVTPLLNSGFANVFGYQPPNKQVNNGVMMARKDTATMRVFEVMQHEVFDGGWPTHSVELLTLIAKRMGGIEGEVLLLPATAFAPIDWLEGNVRAVFEPHEETKATVDYDDVKGHILAIPETDDDILAWWKQDSGREKWEWDFTEPYMLHAFKGHEGWSSNVTLEYVLKRQSQYARIVFPAVWHAITEGIMPWDVPMVYGR